MPADDAASASQTPAAPDGVNAERIIRAIEEELAARPPTIGVIGLSGVGKSSTINAMFGAGLPVSPTIRGTSHFIETRVEVAARPVLDRPMRGALHVLDAPGLGEDWDLDKKYKDYYRRHLKKCDVVLWIIAARNRALALDQQYLKSLRGHLPNLVLGVNQVDLVEPRDWNGALNLPSQDQSVHISAITADRSEKMTRFLGKSCPIVAYSAEKYYGLHDLFLACMKAAPHERRWMFDVIRAFSPEDWLNRASGLTQARRTEIVRNYRRRDSGAALAQALAERFN